MRHNKKFNHLSRKTAHRASMLANMTVSLIFHKRINTTLAKAKALRMYAEPLINRAKEDTMANRRLVFSYLQNKEAVKILFQEIAETCFIELVDYNEAMLKDSAAAKSKTRRSRRKKAAPAAETAAENPVEAAKAEEAELPKAEE